MYDEISRINYLEDLIRIDIQRIATHFFVFFFGAFIKIFINIGIKATIVVNVPNAISP